MVYHRNNAIIALRKSRKTLYFCHYMAYHRIYAIISWGNLEKLNIFVIKRRTITN